MDLASDDQLDEEMEILESQGFDKIMAISAKTGMNIEKLKQLIKRTLN
jgi:GTPase Era involved in 16S rRNA processing